MRISIFIIAAIFGLSACGPKKPSPEMRPPNAEVHKPISANPNSKPVAAQSPTSSYVRKFSQQYARVAIQEPRARWALGVYKKRGVCVGKILEKELTRNEARRIYQVYKTSKTWADWEAAMQPLFDPTREYVAQYGANAVAENLNIMMSLPDAIKECET